jgi:hypothetical protein
MYLDVTGQTTYSTSINVDPPASPTEQELTFQVSNTAAIGGAITVAVRAEDTTATMSAQEMITLAVVDKSAPEVTIADPRDATRFRAGDRVALQVMATDAVGVREIRFATSGAVTQNGLRQITPASANASATFIFTIPSDTAAGDVQVNAFAKDTSNNESAAATITISIAEELPVTYVDLRNNSGNEYGDSWPTAFNTIQEGIDAAYDIGGGEVWVAGGVYSEARDNPTGSIILKSGVHVYGGFAGSEQHRDEPDIAANMTVIDGAASRGGAAAVHVVLGSNNARLDGFTITGGNANGLADLGKGGGMYNPDVAPTVFNCVFKDNLAGSGGGMYNGTGAAPLVVNCVFTNNLVASVGGGAEILEWLWDFGDGTASTEQDPLHQYTALGTYTVSLTVRTASGTDTEVKQDLITVTD